MLPLLGSILCDRAGTPMRAAHSRCCLLVNRVNKATNRAAIIGMAARYRLEGKLAPGRFRVISYSVLLGIL
jgi:hypothetical protein